MAEFVEALLRSFLWKTAVLCTCAPGGVRVTSSMFPAATLPCWPSASRSSRRQNGQRSFTREFPAALGFPRILCSDAANRKGMQQGTTER